MEKDALSAIFEQALAPYRIGLIVGHGYLSASEVYRIAQRIKSERQYASPLVLNGQDVKGYRAAVILYWGDFDPSGEDMVSDLQGRLRELDCHAAVIKIGLTREQVDQYTLPPNFTKTTDSRAAAHIAKYGDISVELDALPVGV